MFYYMTFMFLWLKAFDLNPLSNIVNYNFKAHKELSSPKQIIHTLNLGATLQFF